MKVEPQQEHHWLHRLVGDWTYESEMLPGPGQPTLKTSGTQSYHSVGGLWILGEGKGAMPSGGSATMHFTFGYDTMKKRFVGTFIGSMMTYLWLYDGELQGDVLTLNAEGPSFTDAMKMSKYQDIFEMLTDDHHVLSSQLLGDDGNWVRFMTAHYRRVK